MKSSLRQTLALLIASGVVAAAILTAASLWGAQRAGAAAERTFVAKDVTADILPPPMYLIELRLVVSQAIEGTMPIDRARSEAVRLRKEYLDRVDYWNEHPPFGLEEVLLGRQHQAATRMFAQVDVALDAIARGDKARIESALRSVNRVYLEHRAGVDDTVKASVDFASVMPIFRSRRTSRPRACSRRQPRWRSSRRP